MSTACVTCTQPFIIEKEDEEFYTRFEVPPARNCPTCRLKRRLMERNPKSLYYRTCDKTGQRTLSQYHPSQPFPVYSPKSWWSDEFDATNYGRAFDFNRSFFEQMLALKHSVPHLALFNTEGTMENSEFNNCVGYVKNCYLIAESDYDEDCYYSNLLKKCTDVVDCSVCYEDELMYECIDCQNSYRLAYCNDCQQCRDSFFLKNCIACTDCIGCINQRQKQYMIFNTQYTREEYEQHKKAFQLDTAEGVEALRKQVHDFFITQPHKAVIGEHNQSSSGDHLYNSKNARHCFDSKDLEDCRYCAKLSLGVKNSMDYNSWGNQSELMYQCSSTGDHCYNCRFIVMSQVNMVNCTYCYECFSCQDCFGCVGLKKKRYCILNKQYTKEEYLDLLPRIIEHMKRTLYQKTLRAHSASAQASEVGSRGSQQSEAELINYEYGEFFPLTFCPFGYNETLAMDVFPLTQEEAKAEGLPWRDEEEKNPQPQNYKVPSNIHDVQDDITGAVLLCACRRNFKIIEQELKFYRTMGVPIPKRCPTCRHRSRMKLRNPLMLWERTCAHCNKATLTSYAPDRPEPMYCESCYLQEVY